MLPYLLLHHRLVFLLSLLAINNSRSAVLCHSITHLSNSEAFSPPLLACTYTFPLSVITLHITEVSVFLALSALC